MYRLLLLNFVDSFIDNCILSCVDEPAYGGIVQCELLFGLAAHSGIYVGNGDIVHLDGDGTVIKSKAKGFLDRLDGWNSAISVYTDCMDLTPQGCTQAAERAQAAGIQIATPSYEGVRLVFPQGWALLRMSLHDPNMPLNIESKEAGGCKEITASLRQLLTGFEQLDISVLDV